MTKKDYKILFRSKEKVLEISPASVCHLVEGGLSGFDCTFFDVATKSYSSAHGGYAARRRFGERTLSVTFELEESTEDIRRQIISMMDPTVDCVLDVYLYGKRRVIDVIPYEEARFERGTFFDMTEVTLTFMAPGVFFCSPEEKNISFATTVPLFTFPMNLMKDAGTVTGIKMSSTSAVIDNDGDGECGITVTIRAKGGSVVNPAVSMGGKKIRCLLTLADGDVLIIDGRSRIKKLYKNGESVFCFDKDSVFFSLPAGKSTLNALCDSGSEYIEISVRFTPVYFGM